MGNVLIIKYHNQPTSADLGIATAYAKVVARKATKDTPYNNAGKQYIASLTALERSEAMEMVDKLGLVPVLKTDDGKIWDTPERDFLTRYGGNIIVD